QGSLNAPDPEKTCLQTSISDPGPTRSLKAIIDALFPKSPLTRSMHAAAFACVYLRVREPVDAASFASALQTDSRWVSQSVALVTSGNGAELLAEQPAATHAAASATQKDDALIPGPDPVRMCLFSNGVSSPMIPVHPRCAAPGDAT